jgi:hypothetical protein
MSSGACDPNDKSGNIFQDVLKNAKCAEEKYIGPDYPYYRYIKTPSEIGMSGDGSLSALGKDIDGLIGYVELLVSGGGKASATGQPLGNKFFLKTGGKCTDKSTGQDVDRYIYINNVPTGQIPFISQGLGVNFSEFKGLIPGTISNLNAFNPMEMFQSFLAGSKPDCQELTMETIDIYNNKSTESHFVTLVDIQNMDPCIFQNRTNPITKVSCRETFTNLKNSGIQNNECYTCYKIPKDPISQLYFASLGAFGIYVLYRIMQKNGMVPN